MKAKRKPGKTISKSKKKRALNDARVQNETTSSTSERNGKVSSSFDSQSKITDLKTGEKAYQNMRSDDEQVTTFMGDKEGGEVSINKGKGTTYYSFDKDMNLKKDGKSIKEIDPIALGDLIEASASKSFDGYSKGGKMKAKKYKKGGQVDPPKGKKLTKEMVDKQHSSDLDKSANVTNKLAKQASTGLKDNGFPMSKAAKKALAKDVEKRKKRESTSKPNYRDVGKPIPGGASPRFKKGGKVATTASKKEAFKNRALESSSEKPKGYKEKSKKMGVSTLEERQAERKAARSAKPRYKMGGKMKKYLKGGQVKLDANKDGKITGQDFKMLKKK